MSSDQEYSGYTNFATWRINLEVISDYAESSDQTFTDEDELAAAFEEHVEEILTDGASGLALDYARAFVSDVNWGELAHQYADELIPPAMVECSACDGTGYAENGEDACEACGGEGEVRDE